MSNEKGTLGDLLVRGLEFHVWCLAATHGRVPSFRHRGFAVASRALASAAALAKLPAIHRSGQALCIEATERHHLGSVLPSMPAALGDARRSARAGQNWTCPGCRRPLLMHTRKEPPSAAPFAPWSHLSPG